LRLWLITTLGLALGFGLVPQIIFAHFREPSHGHLPLPAVLLMLTGLLIWLAEPALLILSVKRLELRPLRALGLAKPTLRDFGLGFVAFVVASGVTHLSTSIISKHAPAISSTIVGPMAALMRMPIWIGVALAVFNGFSEELAARGYAIERFERIRQHVRRRDDCLTDRSCGTRAVVGTILSLADRTHTIDFYFAFSLAQKPSAMHHRAYAVRCLSISCISDDPWTFS